MDALWLSVIGRRGNLCTQMICHRAKFHQSSAKKNFKIWVEQKGGMCVFNGKVAKWPYLGNGEK